jgi:hypothetical protein
VITLARSEEIMLLAGLVVVGTILTLFCIRQVLGNARWLLERKSQRGERGRQFIERMSAGPIGYAPGHLPLRGRDLRDEDLAGAFLSDADLSDTDLRGVDLRGADLDGAWLRGARYDAETRWPEGFDPKKRGAAFVE